MLPNKVETQNINDPVDKNDLHSLESIARDYYQTYSRPGLSKLLKTLRMQQCYSSAEGDYLFYTKSDKTVKVVDALGGFGACIFGHNHLDLVNHLQGMLFRKTPVLAQGSTRVNTAILGHKLSQMLEQRFGEGYVSITLNTGADAVEAAIKHCEMSRNKRLLSHIDDTEKLIEQIKKLIRHQSIDNLQEFSIEIQAFLGKDISTIDHAISELQQYLRQLKHIRPTTLAIKRGYHGKTTGALQLTYGEAYRSPFMNLGPNSLFVDPEDNQSLDHAIESLMLDIPKINLDDKQARLSIKKMANITGLFCEPLQGEGGIRPLTQSFLKECEEKCKENLIPLVLDEIQSGMGRTGTFLYCEQLGIKPDIVLLSKSLGGGLCKISTACIKQSIYDPDFDEVHSSTFAEDDLSAGVAVRSLEMIEQPDYLKKASNAGDYLKQGLLQIQKDYPEIVDDVRGHGLFLGFAFRPQVKSHSFVIRFLSESEKLGYVIAGYLLHEHNIRIGTTLSDSHVLRIEPSLYISSDDCDLIVTAIRTACEILAKANAYELTKYLLGQERESSFEIQDFSKTNCGKLPEYEKGLPTVTFVATPASALHVMDSDISLKCYKPNDVVKLLAQIVEVLGPVETETRTIESITGQKINFRMLILMYDPVFISGRLAKGYLDDILDNIKAVQKESEQRHHTVLGLGSYTSIVSHNGLDLTTDQISLTTGNALTVGMGARAIMKAAQENSIAMNDAVMAVLGAGGNIGSVYSEVLADAVSKLILIGRENRLERLYQTAATIYKQAHEAIKMNRVAANSIAEQLSASEIYNEWALFNDDSEQSYQELVSRLCDGLKEKAPITITSDMNTLRQANLILTCSNAPTPIVYANMLGEHKTVICDVSVPQDVDDSVAYELDNVELIRGGLVRLPKNPDILWLGNQCLGSGVSYACMAETMLLGLEGQKEHGSYGKISKYEVKRILEIADIHGFELAKIKVEKVF